MSGDDFKSIPIVLPPGYELRRLDERHIDWASAIVAHTNMFYNPIWPVIYPENIIDRTYRMYQTLDYLVSHQIASGLSFGVFITDYRFKRPESIATDGKLYWDLANPSKDESGAELLEQMDFPLCSVALSYDGINPLDHQAMGSLVQTLPVFADIHIGLQEYDKRDSASWKPTGHRQVLMRNATSTRHDAEGKGIMKGLAQFVMRYADHLGFRGAQIECVNDKVTWVWSNPPSPFKGQVVSEFKSHEYRSEIDGKTINPFDGTHLRITRVYVTLKEHAPEGHGALAEDTQVGAIG